MRGICHIPLDVRHSDSATRYGLAPMYLPPTGKTSVTPLLRASTVNGGHDHDDSEF